MLFPTPHEFSLTGTLAKSNALHVHVRFGSKRTLEHVRVMSALPPKADIAQSTLARDRGGTINGYAIPVVRAMSSANNSGGNNSCAGKFVERRVDSDRSRLLPDQQTPRRLMLPNA